LIAVTAGVAYGCATFVDLTLSTYSESFAADYSLTRVFLIFVVVLALAAVLNIFSSHLMAVMNNVSVWWHVAGASAIVLILLLVPDQHQSFSYVFTERFNNSGFADGSTSSLFFFFAVVPFGFLLTQYTITGFDACAHLSEETSSASMAAAKGIWRSILYSALGGYVLLLCVVFAVPNTPDGAPDNAGVGGGGGGVHLRQLAGHELGHGGPVHLRLGAVLLRHVVPHLSVPDGLRLQPRRRHPGLADLVGADRHPGPRQRRDRRGRGGRAHQPARPDRGEHRNRSRTTDHPGGLLRGDLHRVIGLYLSFAIPIYLRWRRGDRFELGAWNNGAKYKWMNPIAVAETVVVSLYLMMPFVPGAVPFSADFEWQFVNYAPVVTVGAVLLLFVWWQASAKHWYTGPKHTIDETVVQAFDQ